MIEEVPSANALEETSLISGRPEIYNNQQKTVAVAQVSCGPAFP